MKNSSSHLFRRFEQEVSQLYPQLLLKKFQMTGDGGNAEMTVQGNTFPVRFIACFHPYPSKLKAVWEQPKKQENKIMLARYFPPRSQAFLEEEGVSFIDLSGNCLLVLQKENGKHTAQVAISGKPNRYAEPEVLQNIFFGKSSRIIRFLLESFPKFFMPLDIARHCHVSPALVTKVICALDQKKYVFKENRREKVVEVLEPGLLLDRFADVYEFQQHVLERRLLVDMPANELLKSFRGNAGFVVTRTAAASLVAPFAHYNVIDVYKASDKYSFPGREVEGGENLRIWAPADERILDFKQEVKGIQIVGLIQLYLDLYSDPKRGKEQADFLRRRKLKF